jgi:large subunit ribosomal protein L24e
VFVLGRRFKCVVCGRLFPEGQGVFIGRGGLTLTFHSSRCAYKFLKLLFERADERCVLDTARGLALELERVVELREARVQKRV